MRDNGHGVRVENRALLGQRYCTSKLVSFNDLEAVETYGFRGTYSLLILTARRGAEFHLRVRGASRGRYQDCRRDAGGRDSL